MPSPDGRIDLRSDTVTTPTPEMRRAMADAEVGDDVYGEDPTINRFQERAAELLGKEAALYVPSGTMANQLALRVLARPGTEVLCAARAHVFRYEAAAAAWNSAVQLHPFPDDDGLLDAGALDETVQDAGHHSPAVSLIAIENTHMPTCGRAWRVEEVAAVGAVGRRHGVALYCDGARIWNASVALGVPARDLVAPATAVMFCVSKGLGAPVGSVLCGPARPDPRSTRAPPAPRRRHAPGGGDRGGGARRAGHDDRAPGRRPPPGAPAGRSGRRAVAGLGRARRRRDQHGLRDRRPPPERPARPARRRGHPGGHDRHPHSTVRHPQGRRRRRHRAGAQDVRAHHRD